MSGAPVRSVRFCSTRNGESLDGAAPSPVTTPAPKMASAINARNRLPLFMAFSHRWNGWSSECAIKAFGGQPLSCAGRVMPCPAPALAAGVSVSGRANVCNGSLADVLELDERDSRQITTKSSPRNQRFKQWPSEDAGLLLESLVAGTRFGSYLPRI